MRLFRLSQRLLRRDWRAGELRTLIFALVVAVAAVACIGLVTDRLTKAMARESAELIGGDLVIRSTREPDPSWLAMGRALGMATARIYTLDSVLFHGDDMLLAGIKAVTDNYPLRGRLRVAESRGGPSRPAAGIPPAGSAWVDPRVLDRLNAELGDEVQFGAMTLRLEKLLTYEPDQGNNLFQLAPRVLINAADLDRAQVLGPGSRVRYRTLFAGDNAPALRAQLEPLMTTGHRIMAPLAGEGGATEALVDALQFVKLAALLAIVLAAIAIALAARRYSERHYDLSAMLRCLGARQGEVTRLYLYQLALFTASAVVAGCLAGWALHWLLAKGLEPLLATPLPAPGLLPLVAAGGTALLLTAGFALPPVLRLAKVPPLRVFRRDLEPMPLTGRLVYGTAGLAVMAVVWLLFDDVQDILLILAMAVLALMAAGWLIFGLLQRLRRSPLARHRLAGRSLRNLASHAGTSTSQILAFGLALMVILLVGQLRTDLLRDWRLQLPEKVPNYFAFNILPGDLPAFREVLDEASLRKPFYPIVRGRLTAIKGQPVRPGERTDSNRELNLTWAASLPADNEIIAGAWPPTGDGVSIEADYAERLGVTLGDTLTFNSGGRVFEAEVSSLRTVVWESFSPNFFLIFSEEKLKDLPATYLTSFRLEDDQRELVRRLLSTFPSVTLIEVDALIGRLQEILAQVTLAVEMMMGFVLLGGLAVLFAAILTTADERLREGALMRAVGASRRYLRRAFVAEFGLIGALAGLLAVVGAELAGYILYRQVFSMAYPFGLLPWLTVPVAALAIGLAGYAGTRRVVRVSPTTLLE